MPEKMKPRTIVRATTHPSDSRSNIPTAELESFARPEEKRPATVRYPRDPTLDPQLVWKGKDEQDTDGVQTFQLIFESATCDECGATIPVTRPCPCGRWEPRDDEYVARRRQGVAGLADTLSTHPSPTCPLGLQEAIQALTPWIADYVVALDAVGDRSAEANRIRESVAALVNLRRQAAAVPRQRPWLAVWDPLREVLEHLAAMAIVQLDEATAPDPDSAHATEAVAQGHLDAAAAAIRVVGVRLDRWGIDSSIRLPDSLVRAASDAYDVTGAADFIDLDAHGRPLYTRISGRIDAPVGVGVGLLLDLGQADQAFDEARLYRVARMAYRRLDLHRDGLAALLDESTWRADLLDARRIFYEARLTTETLLRELPGDRRIEVETVLRLGSRVAERVSHAIVGLVVAVEPNSHLKRSASYKAVLQAARQAELGDLLLGFDDRVRNAGAHDDYEIQEEHVVLNSRRGPAVRLHDDELVDIVLAGLESAAAILAGLDCILIELEHPAAGDRFGDLPVGDRVQVLLAAMGVEPTRVKVARNRVEVSGRSRASVSVKPLTVIAGLVPYLPHDLRSARLHLKRRDATLAVEVELGPLRRFRESSGMLKDIAVLEFLARATINGRAVFPRQHVRFMMGYLAHETISTPLETAEPALRGLVGLARRLSDRDLAESVQAFIVAKAAREGGPPMPASSRAALDRLATWVGTRPGPWNDGSPPTPPLPSNAVPA